MKRLLAFLRFKKKKKETPQISNILSKEATPIKLELFRDDSDLGYC